MLEAGDAPRARESAVIVPLQLPPALERVRRAYVPVALLGVPAHVTLLYPFIPPGRIRRTDISSLRRLTGGASAFELLLSRAATFEAHPPYPGTTWLAPEPAEPFVRLTRAIWAAFPAYPPFEGEYDDIVPHVTVADDASRLAEVTAIAATTLPVRSWVSEAWLIVEGADGRWVRRARLALGRQRLGPAGPAR